MSKPSEIGMLNYEVKKWEEQIRSALYEITEQYLKKSYPFIVDVADIHFYGIHYPDKEIAMKITFFFKPEYQNKTHENLDREIRTFLEMMQLNPKYIMDSYWELHLSIQSVSSE